MPPTWSRIAVTLEREEPGNVYITCTRKVGYDPPEVFLSQVVGRKAYLDAGDLQEFGWLMQLAMEQCLSALRPDGCVIPF